MKKRKTDRVVETVVRSWLTTGAEAFDKAANGKGPEGDRLQLVAKELRRIRDGERSTGADAVTVAMVSNVFKMGADEVTDRGRAGKGVLGRKWLKVAARLQVLLRDWAEAQGGQP